MKYLVAIFLMFAGDAFPVIGKADDYVWPNGNHSHSILKEKIL